MRRAVVWDEQNLHDNEEYHKLHPVTKPIDEPKTPYEPNRAMNEEGEFIDEDGEVLDPSESENSSWDSKINAVAHDAKLHACCSPVLPPPPADAPPVEGPPSKRPRAKISIQSHVPEEIVKAANEKRHNVEFKQMRKVVYADEGNKFKQMLQRGSEDED